jgi:hypothetical protein
MSTAEWHLPDRPDGVLDSVSEQDRNRTFVATVYQYSALLHRVARSVTRDISGDRKKAGGYAAIAPV